MLKCLIAGTCLLSCQSNQQLAAPDWGTANTMILIAESEAGLSVNVVARDDPTPAVELAYLGDRIELTTLFYACPPAVLGLFVGRQSSDRLLDEIPLPPPIAVYRSELGESQSAWSETTISARVSEILRRLPLGDENLCNLYTVTFGEVHSGLVDLPKGEIGPSFGIPLDEHSILYGLRDPSLPLFRVTDRAEVELVDLSTTTPHSAAFRTDDGELFLLDHDGRVVRGTIEGFTALPERAPPGFCKLDGAKNGPFELYLASDQRTFSRFDGSSWEVLKSGPELLTKIPPSVVWLGPQKAIATGAGRTVHHVVRYQDGNITEEHIPTTVGHVRFLAHVPTLGTFITGSVGPIAHYQDETKTWAAVPRDAPPGEARGVCATPFSIIYSRAGIGELITQYHPVAGYCPTGISMNATVKQLVYWRDHLYLLPEPTERLRLGVTVATAIKKPDPCLAGEVAKLDL